MESAKKVTNRLRAHSFTLRGIWWPDSDKIIQIVKKDRDGLIVEENLLHDGGNEIEDKGS